LCDLGNADSLAAQQALGQCHAPRQQVFHRRHTHGVVEPDKEGRAGKGRRLCQQHNRPCMGGAFVHLP
jgi:hypothetical protein